jgi:hypothetical protein
MRRRNRKVAAFGGRYPGGRNEYLPENGHLEGVTRSYNIFSFWEGRKILTFSPLGIFPGVGDLLSIFSQARSLITVEKLL